MARHTRVERSLSKGIQPFITQNETVLHLALASNRATLATELLTGQLLGGAIDNLIGDAIATRGKKQYILGLTTRRLILVEVVKWSFLGEVKKVGASQAIALSAIGSIEYRRKGIFEGLLVIHLNGTEMTLVFERLPWVRRANEMVKTMLSRGIVSKSIRPLPIATGKLRWSPVLATTAGWMVGGLAAIPFAATDQELQGLVIFGLLGGTGVVLALRLAGISLGGPRTLAIVVGWVIGTIPLLGWIIGGLVTGISLAKDQPSIRALDVLVIAGGWVAAWIIGGVAVSSTGASIDSNPSLIALWASCAGAIGGLVMFWRLGTRR